MKKHFVLLGMMLIPMLWGMNMPVYADEATVPLPMQFPRKITLIDGDISSVIKLDDCGRISEPAHYQMDGYEFVGWMNVETGKMWNFNDGREHKHDIESRVQKTRNSIWFTCTFNESVRQCKYICRHGYRTLGPDWCARLV